MSASDTADIYRLVSGRNDPGANFMRLNDAADNIQDFHRQLEEARNGGFPATVAIDTNQEPFRSIMRVPSAHGAQHVITLLGIDDNGDVEYRNSYLANQVFRISPAQLLDAMHLQMYDSPEYISGFAEGINNAQPNEQALHRNVLNYLTELAPSRRPQALRQLRSTTHRDLARVLSNEESERLGLGRNLLGRVGHAIGVN